MVVPQPQSTVVICSWFWPMSFAIMVWIWWWNKMANIYCRHLLLHSGFFEPGKPMCTTDSKGVLSCSVVLFFVCGLLLPQNAFVRLANAIHGCWKLYWSCRPRVADWASNHRPRPLANASVLAGLARSTDVWLPSEVNVDSSNFWLWLMFAGVDCE